MYKLDDSHCQSNKRKKQRGKQPKNKSSRKTPAKNCWPHVTISRECTFHEKNEVDTCGTFNSSCPEESSNRVQLKEENDGCDIEHLCCDQDHGNFEEEQSVCLISSSSEIEENVKVCETITETDNETILGNLGGPTRANDFDYSTGDLPISDTSRQDRPIFVDLTADEKTWKRTVFKSCANLNDDATRNSGIKNEGRSSCFESEHRVMVADSSSKIICNGNNSLATALRGRGPCVLPIQPNRSLPIHPAPSVPTRCLRKECLPLLILPKSSTLNMVEGVSANPAEETLPRENRKKKESISSTCATSKRKIGTTVDYVVPQISGVKSLSETKRRDCFGVGVAENDAKEIRKKKRPLEADSSENKGKYVECSIKEFLKNFYGSSITTEIENMCTDKRATIASTSKEENCNKVVPPLRLKKVVHTDAEWRSKSQAIVDTKHRSNYRIVPDASQQRCSPTLSNSNDTDPAPLNTDSYKLKYRRAKLKHKLQELRGKALELAEQMANDGNAPENTRLRQVMNRYEKQIENLSKLHSKLSAIQPTPKGTDGGNARNTVSLLDKYSSMRFNEGSAELSIHGDFLPSSPEPPQLSPRSPVNYDQPLLQSIRNSPPILSRICVPVSLNQEPALEEVEISEKKVWSANEGPLGDTHSKDTLHSESMNGVSADPKKDIGETYLKRQDSKQSKTVNVEDTGSSPDKRPLDRSATITILSQNECTAPKRNEQAAALSETFAPCRLPADNKKSENVKCLEFSNVPAAGSLEALMDIQGNEMFQMSPNKQVYSSVECISQSNSYEPVPESTPFSRLNAENSNARKQATSNSEQPLQFGAVDPMFDPENLTRLRRNFKGEKISSSSAQQTASSRSLTEQFPTLGNWLARISNKQGPKGKSKLKTLGNSSLATTENPIRTAEHEGSETVGSSNSTNDVLHATSQSHAERWQYRNHQQQQRQLLQHVASSVSLPQPVAPIPSLRSGICPPIPMTHFYPNNYGIDSCNGAALTYHPTIYPYSTYPYHSRLHSSSLSGYHFPIQDSLRAMQSLNKRFPSVQDPMLRFTPPSTSTLRHSSNVEFDRLRGNSVTNNVAATTCLSSLFLPGMSLSSTPQVLSHAPLIGHSTSNQFSQNRMVPDVVAAAAAAAVVAATSFDRQRDTLTYNRTDTDHLSTTNIANNIIDGQPPRVTSSNKPVATHRDATNRAQDDTHFSEESQENVKYQQMQKLLFDRLALVEASDNSTQPSSIIGNDVPPSMATILSATPYRVPLLPPHAQISKNILGNESRNCETPHLGEMNRSPNSRHNFNCSNCGLIEPKFKCLGCEMAFYCNERCQEEHWYIHVQKCPKKMPKLKKVT